jgi:DeoR/GlpR family transcriptional regulator of sugar metabolism
VKENQMKREDRRREIMNVLIENRVVGLDELAERFGVSKMTIHRDLDELEHEGVLRKVRGGATIDPGTQFESDFRIRATQEADVKMAIAREALALVEPGMTVMVNDGSMAFVFGEMLLEKRPLTVITNNAALIDRLKGESGMTLLALGGVYSDRFNAYFGLLTEAALAGLKADAAFVSAPAADDVAAYHMDEAAVRTKRAMLAATAHPCLLINSRRFGHTSLHRLADLTEFKTIVSDRPLPEETDRKLRKAGVTIKIAHKEDA